MAWRAFPWPKSRPSPAGTRRPCASPFNGLASGCAARPPWPASFIKNSLAKFELKHLNSGEKGMITRDEIRELAAFSADETTGACALSFYFQPDTPQDRSHRSEAILAKDLVKQALKEGQGKGRNG